jgi:hypothetical protein
MSEQLLPLIARWFSAALVARRLATWLHEVSHASTAALLGYDFSIDLASERPSVTVSSFRLSCSHACMIRHAGWVTSCLLACATVSLASWKLYATHDTAGSPEALLTALSFTVVAAEAMQSDLLSSEKPAGRFFCGNFGLLLLNQISAGRVHHILRRMLEITMMRGAQSAGLVTYRSSRGVRYRVVNGKRTDLAGKLLSKATSITRPSAITAPQLFQGHTRFATSSIANMQGTHPHQWTPPHKERHWKWDDGVDTMQSRMTNVEAYITHKSAAGVANPNAPDPCPPSSPSSNTC